MTVGSVATQLRCGGQLITTFLYCKILAECDSLRIFKIGQYLARILTNVSRHVFCGPPSVVNCKG